MSLNSYRSPKVLKTQTNNGVDWKTLESSNQTYYSGLDASVYIGINGTQLFLGEVVSLQYELQEQVMPLFRYSDYTFADTIRGARMAQGSFTINFQQSMLIYMILEYFQGLYENGGRAKVSASTSTTPTSTTGLSSVLGSSVDPYATINSAFGINTLLSPDFVTAETATQQYLQTRTPATQKKLVTTLNSVTTSTKNTAALQSVINQNKLSQNWITNQFSAPTPNTPGGSLLIKTKERLTPLFSRLDGPPNLELNVVFGAMSKADYLETYQVPDSSNSYVPKSYQEIHQGMANGIAGNSIETALESMPPYTVRKITGIEITGFGSSCDDSGRPILESMAWIARDII